MCWEIRLIYQLQLHFLTRQESLTHKVEEGTILFGLWAGSVLRCFMEYCGFITSCCGFNPCNNHHNSVTAVALIRPTQTYDEMSS